MVLADSDSLNTSCPPKDFPPATTSGWHPPWPSLLVDLEVLVASLLESDAPTVPDIAAMTLLCWYSLAPVLEEPVDSAEVEAPVAPDCAPAQQAVQLGLEQVASLQG